MVDNQKIKGYISIAKKAGYAIIGSEKLENHKKKLYLLLVDREAGKNTIKVADAFGDVEKITISSLAELVQIQNCKILGIKNKGISEQIIKILRSEKLGK